MILAGDVGGTKVHLALYNFEGGRLKPVRDQKFPAPSLPTLDAVVKQFLGDPNDRRRKTERRRLRRPASAVRGRCAMDG
jgi:glucokinase